MPSDSNRSMTLVDDEDEYHRALDESLNLASINAEGNKKRMLEQANECRKKGKRMMRELWRLEQEAEQMYIEERKYRKNADAANTLCSSLHFDTVLVRLTRNDTNTIVVDCRNFPPGHGRSLGEALQRNTMVTKLDLQLCTLFTALDSERRAKQEMEPLLKFLTNNTSLVSFGAHHSDGGSVNSVLRKMSNMLLESISKLKQIERLTWGIPITPTSFRTVMKSCSLLRELDVTLDDDPNTTSTHSNQRTVLSGFRSNPMLRKLKLGVADDPDLFNQITSRLSEVSTLEELVLKAIYEDDDALIDALSTFTQATSALQRLELDGFILNDTGMTTLVTALQLRRCDRPGCLPTVLISALSFRTCDIDRNACKRLSSFLQIKTGDETLTFNSGLRELHVSAQDEEDVVTGRMGSFLSRKLAASILKARPKHEKESDADGGLLSGNSRPLLIPTIGSQITTLSLMWVHSCFFHHLRDNVDRIGCLQNLELVGMTKAASMAFSKCIPKLRSIHTLKVLPMSEQDSAVLDWILRGLQHNQSILTVITSDDHTKTEFSDGQLRLMDAYCQRNQFLAKLLGSELREQPQSNNGMNVVSSNDDTAALCIRPELLTVAHHISDARSAMFAQGLLALGCSVGEAEPSDASPPRSLIGTVGTALWSLPTGVVSAFHSFLFGTPR